MHLDKSEIQTYRDRGYIIKRGIIDARLSNALVRTYIKVMRKYDTHFDANLMDCHSWSDPRLSKATIEFRKRDSQTFGVFYDALQNSSLLQALFTQVPLMRLAADLLDDDVDALSSTGHMLRIDVPQDTKNILNWHQDSAYYKQNTASNHGCVVLLPLVDLQKENGTVVILEGSHREGILEHEFRTEGKDSSEKFTVPDEVVSRYNEIHLEATCDDIVIFQMNLIHKSRFNSSEGVRFSAGIRHHKTLANDFLPGRLIYEPNKTAEKILAGTH